MEIQKAKQTEIGNIPKEWEIATLRDVVENDDDIVAGPFGSNLKVSDYRENGIPIIRLQNIERNEFIHKDIKFVSNKKADELKYHSFRAGDIVLAKLGAPIGKASVVPSSLERGIVVADVVRIRVSPKKASTYFVEYILNSAICTLQLQRETIGTTRPRVNIFQVRNIRIPLPPLPEQKKIAEILSTVDQAIEKVDEAIEKTQKLKKGLMQELLTRGIGHKEFRDTDIGRIPNEWEIVKISELGRIITGGTPSTSNNTYWNGSIPFITPADIKGDKYVYQTERYITSEGAKKIGFILPPNTVLVVCIGSTIGKTGVAYGENVINQQINAIICDEKVSKDYVYYAVTFRADLLKSFSGIAAVPIIKKSLFEQFKIPLAPLPEQQKIAEILGGADERLELLRKRRERLEKIKRGLMNDLLTGKKRVKLN